MHQVQCREGCIPSKPSPCRKEKQRQSAEHLPFPPHPELRESWEFSTFSCFWAETPSGQGHEDGHGITSPSAAGRKGMAPVACNTNPCLKSLSPLTHKRDQIRAHPTPVAQVEPSCPCTAIALLCRVERGSSEPACSRHPSNVSYAGSSSVPPKGQVSI